MINESLNSPHLTTNDLAARFHCTPWTISMNYRKWGLRPLKIGKRLLFPLPQVEAMEARMTSKEFAA